MSILDTLSAFRAPITLLLVLFGPSILPRFINFVRRRRQSPQPTPIISREPLTATHKAVLALHTIYQFLHLYYPPFDLFTTNKLPILAPNALIRRALGVSDTSAAAPDSPHPIVELLLQRLQNADNRINYARFGHQTMMECVWCTSPDDYMVYSLPAVLGVYVGAAVLLGLISLTPIAGPSASRRAERLRSTFGLGIAGMCTADLAARYLWDLRPVQGDCLHLASTIHTLRTVALLLVPLVYTYLPLPSPGEDISALIPHLARSLNVLRLTSVTRLAIKRDHRFRRMDLICSEEAAKGALHFSDRVRTDEDLKSTVDAVLDIPQERQIANRWVQQNWIGWVKKD